MAEKYFGKLLQKNRRIKIPNWNTAENQQTQCTLSEIPPIVKVTGGTQCAEKRNVHAGLSYAFCFVP